MTGFLIKTILLLVLLLWSIKKGLRWVSSRSTGRYGKLASEVLRLVDEFGHGLSRLIFWMLVLTLVVLMGRRMVTAWMESQETQTPPALEQRDERPAVPPPSP